MRRGDFMRELNFLLQDLGEADREEALQYYNDYFEDAGPEKEEEVIRELGSPEQVAAIIKDSMFSGGREKGAYTDAGYTDDRFEQKRMPGLYRGSKESGEGSPYHYTSAQEPTSKEKKKKRSPLTVLLILVLCLCGIPIFAPLMLAVLAVVLGLLFGAIAVVIGLAVSGIAIVIAGIVALVGGIAKLILTPAAGVLMCGLALLVIALGILVTWGIWWLFCKVASPLLNGLIKILRKPFERKGATA